MSNDGLSNVPTKCLKCQTPFKFATKLLGKEVKCPKCSTLVFLTAGISPTVETVNQRSQTVETSWYYLEPTLLGEVEAGPFTTQQIHELIQLGKVKGGTKIKSPQVCKTLTFANRIDQFGKAINQLEIDAQKKKLEVKENRLKEISDKKEKAAAEKAEKAARISKTKRQFSIRWISISIFALVIVTSLIWYTFRIFSPKSTTQIVKQSRPSIALVRGKIGTGTGFLVSPNILVTNSHVVSGEFVENINFEFVGANPVVSVKGILRHEDPKNDVAIFEIQERLTPLTISRSENVQSGDPVTIIGNPGIGANTLENAVSQGVVSTRTTLNGVERIQLGASVNHGNSGGPAFDKFGQVVGMVTSKSTENEGIGFCIPSGIILDAVESANKATPEQLAKLRDTHNSASVTLYIAIASMRYLELHEGIAAAWKVAIESNIDINDGIMIGKIAVESKLNELEKSGIFDDAEAQVRSILRNATVDQKIRDNLTIALANLNEIRNCVKTPNGSYLTYSEHLSEVSSNQQRCLLELRIALGVE